LNWHRYSKKEFGRRRRKDAKYIDLLSNILGFAKQKTKDIREQVDILWKDVEKMYSTILIKKSFFVTVFIV